MTWSVNRVQNRMQKKVTRCSAIIFGRLIGVLLVLMLASCVGHLGQSSMVENTAVPAVSHILVVNTNNDIERYRVAATEFVKTVSAGSEIGVKVDTINLGGDNHPVDTLQDLFNANQYSGVYCIGAKALGSVDYINPDMPVVFSSVLNWRRFIDQARYYGVASEVAPAAQLTWFKYFFPEIKTIGVLYSQDNKKLVQDAAVSAANLSLMLVTEALDSSSKVVSRVQTLLTKVDALWLVSDPLVLATMDSARSVFKLADKQGIPVFAYDTLFVDMGAVLSITTDLPTTGRQAALMMQNALRGNSRQDNDTSVQFPAGSSITLNLDKVRQYNLLLNEDALDSVSQIVGE